MLFGCGLRTRVTVRRDLTGRLDRLSFSLGSRSPISAEYFACFNETGVSPGFHRLDVSIDLNVSPPVSDEYSGKTNVLS
ncbi:MAG: hypothetical protein J7641_14695 [Cyanobacteria bacterium SID2]|nr:hypothetical protein [Cyanobacteria bacterium SID2]MBP0006786.1 hypothetical protein [Cyanobacteria bacterium SBC]